MLTHAAGCEAVVVASNAAAAHIYLGCHGIYRRHHDAGIEGVAADDGLGLGDDKSLKPVDADILEVDVGNERMEHLALGVAHVALQLGEHGDGCRHGHILKHILLPVLAHSVGATGELGSKVAADNLALALVGHHRKDALPVMVDGSKQGTALTGDGRKHHMACSLEIVLVLDVGQVGVLAVGLGHNLLLELLGESIERVAHLLDRHGFGKPLAHLLRVGLHLLLKARIEGTVFLGRIGGGAVDALLDDGETVEHLGGDIECQHGHEDDIHQIDHLLARGYLFLLDCHQWCIVRLLTGVAGLHI